MLTVQVVQLTVGPALQVTTAQQMQLHIKTRLCNVQPATTA